jgi:hypothetical protein
MVIYLVASVQHMSAPSGYGRALLENDFADVLVSFADEHTQKNGLYISEKEEVEE